MYLIFMYPESLFKNILYLKNVERKQYISNVCRDMQSYSGVVDI